MKKYFLMIGILGLIMVGCHKEEEENVGNGGNGGGADTSAVVVKHNVELVYGDGRYQNIAMDTIRKYNADETVDTIFMIPQPYNDFSTNTTQYLQYLVNRLRARHNVNPDKVFGKGELQLDSDATLDHPEIVRFFEDTLRYHVTYYGQAK